MPFDLFTNSILRYMSTWEPPYSLEDYFKLYWDFTLTDTDMTNYRDSWNRRLQAAAKEKNLKPEDVLKNGPNWRQWLAARKEYLADKVKESEESAILSEGSNTDEMTDEQLANYKLDFANMKDEEKWPIGDTFVEDEMYKVGINLTHEHPIHSWIFNSYDKIWETKFTEEQLEELKKCDPLPHNQDLEDFFNQFNNITDLEKLKAIAEKELFDWNTEADLYWAKLRVLDFLLMYKNGTIDYLYHHRYEKDLIVRLWSQVDSCFDDAKFMLLRRELPCVATGIAINNYNITGTFIPNKYACPRPDLIISKDGYEYGCSENSVVDNEGYNTKEVVEGELKLPKDLKNMTKRLIERCEREDMKNQVRTIGFLHSHFRLNTVIMDQPRGYVFRTTPLDQVKIPLNVEDIWKELFSVFETAWIAKTVIKNVADLFVPAGKRSVGFKRPQKTKSYPKNVVNLKQFKKRKVQDSDD